MLKLVYHAIKTNKLRQSIQWKQYYEVNLLTSIN